MPRGNYEVLEKDLGHEQLKNGISKPLKHVGSINFYLHYPDVKTFVKPKLPMDSKNVVYRVTLPQQTFRSQAH